MQSYLQRGTTPREVSPKSLILQDDGTAQDNAMAGTAAHTSRGALATKSSAAASSVSLPMFTTFSFAMPTCGNIKSRREVTRGVGGTVFGRDLAAVFASASRWRRRSNKTDASDGMQSYFLPLKSTYSRLSR